MSRTRGKREAVRSGWHAEGDPFDEEKSGKKQKKQGRGKRTALIALGCVAALVLVAVGAWNIFVKAPDVSDNDRPGVQDKSQTPGVLDGETGSEPDTGSGRKEDYFTFLLIGRDTGGGGNTDTLILVSYDVPNGQVNMMSIPRDTAVNVSWSTKKINSVYNAKESSGGGIEGLKNQVGYLTGVVPDFYVIIEWNAVGELVEAVGGIEFDVPRNMDYDDPYQDLHIHLTKGLQTLNGQQAMEMLRYRHDNDTSVGYNDTGRAETQREFLKAMAKKVIQLQNITKVGEFVKIFMDNVETDLKLSELMWFASKALSVDVETMQSSTMPYTDIGKFRGAYYFLANPEEIVPLVNDQFNPYNRDITLEDLQVIQKNGDGSCYVTNGTLLDSRWSKAYSSSSSSTSGGSSTSSSSGNSSDTTSSTPAETEEPTLPAESGETTEPSGETTQPEESGGTGTTAEDPGDIEEPTLPAEPSLPEESSGQAGGGETANSGGVDEEPPGWLSSGG